ncbi:hypothetical protein TNCV_4334741 [Trichonephila clavipes]|nr:hypothetical protein TNCV_4334741 [Trichonephila clavipes]
MATRIHQNAFAHYKMVGKLDERYCLTSVAQELEIGKSVDSSDWKAFQMISRAIRKAVGGWLWKITTCYDMYAIQYAIRNQKPTSENNARQLVSRLLDDRYRRSLK